MKRIFVLITVVITAIGISAQDNRQQERFSPERFQAQLEEYITKEAHLSQEEATKFFPVYKEMQEKQRTLFDRQRELAKTKPADEQGCLKVIKESDEIELELKRIQQTYHARFLKLLSASKVYDILKAELGFHRHIMRSWGRGNTNGQWSQGFGQRGNRPQGFGQPGFGQQRFGTQGFGQQGFRQQKPQK